MITRKKKKGSLFMAKYGLPSVQGNTEKKKRRGGYKYKVMITNVY